MSQSTYTARWVLPIDGPPIENGRVVIDDGVILDVGPAGNVAGDRDFGDAVLMPGFVNAHTHLEYTALRGFLEDVPFFPWIRALTASKAHIEAEGWLLSTRLGAVESIAAGVTTIGDNADAGDTARVLDETGLRGVVFQEVFGIDDIRTVDAIVEELVAKVAAHRQHESARVRVGVSPHALYTVRPALFAGLRPNPATASLPWSIHVAESPAESELIENGTGPFAEMYARRGIDWTPPRTTPTAYAHHVGALGPLTLAVHCVHQTPADVELLRASGAAVVHCPKSNGKLGAGIAPLALWLRTDGLRVALGTDSAVSNNTLDMFEEMRHALLTQRAVTMDVESVSARDVLRMATLGGAEALGMAAETGSLTVGKRADMIAVRLDRPHATPSSDPCSALVYSARADDVVFTMCDGRVLFDTGVWKTMDATATMKAASDLRSALPSSERQ